MGLDQDEGAKVTPLNPGASGGGIPRAGVPAEGPPAEEAAAGRSAPPGPAGPAGPGEADILAFPEPPAKRRRRRALLAAGVVLGVVGAILAVVVFTPLLAVRTIAVHGTHLLTPAQVEARLEPVRGRSLALVGDEEVAALVGGLVQVKETRTRAEPPGTLVVTVVERTPVALVRQAKTLLVVDGDGVVLGKAAKRADYPVPLIDGAAMPVGKEVFRAVTGVLSALPADVLAKLATASADSPDSVQLRLSDGRTVVWGNAEDRELKSRVLQALMKADARRAAGEAPVNVFDVSAPRHPVTR
ncbi:cell division protein FtsQ/DivIB [Sinomonas halotolerans]|uniref:Cell division protein FtsQ/DivIB n=1 Tax=Sinomonas halotolerans TaxID=1644133 RepID=A0ABU9X371_9MICC